MKLAENIQQICNDVFDSIVFSYGKLPAGLVSASSRIGDGAHLVYPPTLEVASVKLLSVELLPDEGLPTRPIRGSLPMINR